MNKIVVCLAGQVASGKDSVAEYVVKKYNGASLSFSDPLREMLNTALLPINRENLVWLSKSLTDRFGEDVLSKIIYKKIGLIDKKIFILPNVRREGDIACFRDMPGFVLIGVETDPKIRYERLIKRNQNVDDQTKTWGQFQEDSKLSTEISIDDLIKKSSVKLQNNSSLEDLHREIDIFMASLLG